MYAYFFYYAILVLRYGIIAGLAFLIFYVWYKRRFYTLKIQKQAPKGNDYLREIAFSLITFFVFAFVAFVLFQSAINAYTQLYKDIPQYGWGYFWASILLALLIHDTYFYWTHRLMHHRRLFNIFHLTHHRSTNPSPWAAFAFHPLEAFIEAGAIILICFLIPIHQVALVIFILIMTIYNVYGHLGYEIYPLWLINSRFGKWLNTSTNHNMHHKLFRDNYGLYFRFWDELMHTTHPNYENTVTELLTYEEKKTN